MKTIKAKVHMLPTEDGNSIIAKGEDYIQVINKEWAAPTEELQHLYITTDEEIKEGDWFISGVTGNVLQLSPNEAVMSKDRKIIATTDPKLLTRECSNEIENWGKKFVLQIPQSFIEDYCKAGGIDEVLVEVESITNMLHVPNETATGSIPRQEIVVGSKPKLNPDNTIIIHPVEEKMYSMEEMRDFAWKTLVQGRKATDTMKDIFNELPEWFDKWIEENL